MIARMIASVMRIWKMQLKIQLQMQLKQQVNGLQEPPPPRRRLGRLEDLVLGGIEGP
ncbi:hypothetical protein HanIR_Chr01g0041861 [Helianthus annuus]|nr:hypothetical protein HanIR_Chr01g0041861 [Helianthus annuus]